MAYSRIVPPRRTPPTDSAVSRAPAGAGMPLAYATAVLCWLLSAGVYIAAKWVAPEMPPWALCFWRLALACGILLPIVHQLGIDPVHFGMVMVLNLMIGLLHPPMGMVLFVLARVAKLSVERTTMAILPWLFPLLLSLIVLTYVPSISMWLPRTLGM